MDLGLKGKVAVVTASSKGIGKAAAFSLAQEGANVVLCARGKKTLEAAAEEIREKTGVKVLAVQADVSKPMDIKNLVNQAIKEFETIDILVSNAGGPPPGEFMDFTDEDWNYALNLNFLSVIRLIREVIPYMKEKRWGRIINILSVAAKQPFDNLVLSNAARAGVIGLTKTLSKEFAKFNILINNVCPGLTATDRLKEVIKAKADKDGVSYEEEEKKFVADVPLKRLAKPEEIANLIVFLASEKASFITGATIQVDGGFIKGNY